MHTNELAVIIECLIRENGGREKYANTIENEWLKAPVRYKNEINYPENLLNVWTDKQVENLLAYYASCKIKQLMRLIPGKSMAGINSKAATLIRQGKLKHKSHRKNNFVLV